MVLVHGIASRGQSWARVLAELAAAGTRYRVLAPDLLGHGESVTAHGDYSPGGFATVLRDLLAALGHHRASVVGHSFGGGVALQFAYQFPDWTDRLVLVSSGGFGTEVSPLLRAATAPGAEWLLPALTHPRLVAGAAAACWAGQALGLIGPTVAWQQAVQAWTSLARSDHRRAFVHTVRSVLDADGQRISSDDKLYLVAGIPTLIVWGGRDAMIPVAHAHHAAALLPDSTLEIFESAGHFPHDEQPHRFTELLTSFLEGTDAATVTTAEFATRVAAHTPPPRDLGAAWPQPPTVGSPWTGPVRARG